jgi:hypothetical protein
MKGLTNIPPLEVISDFERDELYELYRCGGLPEFMLDDHLIGFGAEIDEVLVYTAQLAALWDLSAGARDRLLQEVSEKLEKNVHLNPHPS